MLLVFATKGSFVGLPAAPPDVAAPNAPMHPARPVEILVLRILPIAVLTVFLLHFLQIAIATLPQGHNSLPQFLYLCP
jgi:hypothetical protein